MQARRPRATPAPVNMAPALGLVEGRTPEQRTFDGRAFPLLLEPVAGTDAADLSEWIQWIDKQRASLDAQLVQHGAILFRGLPVRSAADFDRFVGAFGLENLPYIGGAAPRTNIVGRVFTTNESPPEKLIPFHHEMAQVPTFPSRLWFYCDVPAKEGGETPICLSHGIYRRMLDAAPDFVEALRTKGVRYTRVLPDGDDPSSAIGRGWQSTYNTADRAVAEARCREQGGTCEWLPNGCLRMSSGVLSAVRQDPRTGQWTWFNSIVAAYFGWNDQHNKSETAVTFGDGSLLPREAMLQCSAIMQEEAVAFVWKQGDVLMLDNRLVLHARRSFVPPRVILASLAR